jgi:hypothetical protein
VLQHAEPTAILVPRFPLSCLRIAACEGSASVDFADIEFFLGRSMAQKTIANVQGLFHSMSEDEVLKHALGSYSFEQFEAGSYRMLAAAAREAGEPGIAETCERIQAEEEAMGDWIWQQMPTLTQEYLSRSEVGAMAKR